jgi:hypothetical protein
LIGADRDPVNWSVPSKFNVFSVRPVETGKELSIALRDLIKEGSTEIGCMPLANGSKPIRHVFSPMLRAALLLLAWS